MKKHFFIALVALVAISAVQFIEVWAQSYSGQYCPVTSYLISGSKGGEVSALQKKLIEQGYLSSDNLTGYFGPTTEQALKNWQMNNGISAEGVTGPLTRNKLCSTTGLSANVGVTFGPTAVNTIQNSNTASSDVKQAAEKLGLTSLLNKAPETSCTNDVLRGDFVRDGKVDVWDMSRLGSYYNQNTPSQYPELDINSDGKVAFDELLALSQDFGKYKCEGSPIPTDDNLIYVEIEGNQPFTVTRLGLSINYKWWSKNTVLEPYLYLFDKNQKLSDIRMGTAGSAYASIDFDEGGDSMMYGGGTLVNWFVPNPSLAVQPANLLRPIVSGEYKIVLCDISTGIRNTNCGESKIFKIVTNDDFVNNNNQNTTIKDPSINFIKPTAGKDIEVGSKMEVVFDYSNLKGKTVSLQLFSSKDGLLNVPAKSTVRVNKNGQANGTLSISKKLNTGEYYIRACDKKTRVNNVSSLGQVFKEPYCVSSPVFNVFGGSNPIPSSDLPYIRVSEESLNFNYVIGDTITTEGYFRELLLRNVSDRLVSFRIDTKEQPKWLDTAYSTGLLSIHPFNNPTGVGALINPYGLKPGVYKTQLTFVGNFSNSPLVVPIVLTVQSENNTKPNQQQKVTFSVRSLSTSINTPFTIEGKSSTKEGEYTVVVIGPEYYGNGDWLAVSELLKDGRKYEAVSKEIQITNYNLSASFGGISTPGLYSVLAYSKAYDVVGRASFQVDSVSPNQGDNMSLSVGKFYQDSFGAWKVDLRGTTKDRRVDMWETTLVCPTGVTAWMKVSGSCEKGDTQTIIETNKYETSVGFTNSTGRTQKAKAIVNAYISCGWNCKTHVGAGEITIEVPAFGSNNQQPIKPNITNTEKAAIKNIGLESYLNQSKAQSCTNTALRADFVRDGVIDVWDLARMSTYYNKNTPTQYPELDINADSKVGFDELLALAQEFGMFSCSNTASQGTFNIES